MANLNLKLADTFMLQILCNICKCIFISIASNWYMKAQYVSCNILCIFWWANPLHWFTLSLETVK